MIAPVAAPLVMPDRRPVPANPVTPDVVANPTPAAEAARLADVDGRRSSAGATVRAQQTTCAASRLLRRRSPLRRLGAAGASAAAPSVTSRGVVQFARRFSPRPVIPGTVNNDTQREGGAGFLAVRADRGDSKIFRAWLRTWS